MSIRRSSLICVAYLQVYERVADNRWWPNIGKGGRGNSGHTFGCRNSELGFRQQRKRAKTKTTVYWNFIYVLSVSQVIVFNDNWQDENTHV